MILVVVIVEKSGISFDVYDVNSFVNINFFFVCVFYVLVCIEVYVLSFLRIV